MSKRDKRKERVKAKRKRRNKLKATWPKDHDKEEGKQDEHTNNEINV